MQARQLPDGSGFQALCTPNRVKWADSTGDKLGPYEILSAFGAGGKGEPRYGIGTGAFR